MKTRASQPDSKSTLSTTRANTKTSDQAMNDNPSHSEKGKVERMSEEAEEQGKRLESMGDSSSQRKRKGDHAEDDGSCNKRRKVVEVRKVIKRWKQKMKDRKDKRTNTDCHTRRNVCEKIKKIEDTKEQDRQANKQEMEESRQHDSHAKKPETEDSKQDRQAEKRRREHSKDNERQTKKRKTVDSKDPKEQARKRKTKESEDHEELAKKRKREESKEQEGQTKKRRREDSKDNERQAKKRKTKDSKDQEKTKSPRTKDIKEQERQDEQKTNDSTQQEEQAKKKTEDVKQDKTKTQKTKKKKKPKCQVKQLTRESAGGMLWLEVAAERVSGERRDMSEFCCIDVKGSNEVEGSVNGHPCTVCLDTGSSVTVIMMSLAERMGLITGNEPRVSSNFQTYIGDLTLDIIMLDEVVISLQGGIEVNTPVQVFPKEIESRYPENLVILSMYSLHRAGIVQEFHPDGSSRLFLRYPERLRRRPPRGMEEERVYIFTLKPLDSNEPVGVLVDTGCPRILCVSKTGREYITSLTGKCMEPPPKVFLHFGQGTGVAVDVVPTPYYKINDFKCGRGLFYALSAVMDYID